MKYFRLLLAPSLILALLLLDGRGWAATDTLVCKTVAGGTFTLSSKYKVSHIAKLIPHAQQISDREWWNVTFSGGQDMSQPKIAGEGTSLPFAGLAPAQLADTCSALALIHGMPSTDRGVFLLDGQWQGRRQRFPAIPFKSFPVELAEKRPTALVLKAREAGYIASASERIARLDLLWVIEFTLHRPDRKGMLPLNPVVDAVFQSTSSDNGHSWSEPVITEQGLIFDVGYPLYDSCVLARPDRLNGRKLDSPFPERCKARARP